MKKIYACLLLIFSFTNAKAQTPGDTVDSLRHQLNLQKTGKDSIQVLDQLIMLDDYTDDSHAAIGQIHIQQLLAINKRLKLIDAHPYQLLLKACQLKASNTARHWITI